MKKNSLLDFFKLIIIMLVAVSLLVYSLEAFDSHIDHCQEEHCLHCAMIVYAQSIVVAASAIGVFAAFIFVLVLIISKIHVFINILTHFSLVKLNIQFNE